MNCLHCGKAMVRSNGRGRPASYCSKQCKDRNRKPIHQNNCTQCKRDFLADKKDRRFCSRECDVASRRVYDAATCNHCLLWFTPASNAAGQFCSRTCSFAFKREWAGEVWAVKKEPKVRKPKRSEVVAKALESLRARERYAKNKSTKREKVCVECGGPFYALNKRRFCSVLCCRKASKRSGKAKARIRNRKRELLVEQGESFTSREIFVRDAWCCQLCGKQVNRKAKWPDPQSPTIDHIVPTSKGGHHVRSNVQCAHAKCNTLWSNNDGKQLRLFG